jgi:hypothetical protein
MVRKLSEEELRIEARRAVAAGRRADRGEPRAAAAGYDATSGRVEITLTNGCTFAFPARHAQGISGATDAELARVDVVGGGYALRWEALDADLTVPGLLAGYLGSRRWMAVELGRTGGRARSPGKARAARENGRKGGRPRKRATARRS